MILRHEQKQHLLKTKQQGVAVVTALLLTSLAITIVASLFWQQQVQVRSIENQRFQLQKKWILRGALDWASLILREDGRLSAHVDHAGEPWAVNLGETKLDQYVENGKTDDEDSDASLTGQIKDAQAKYNINNLAADSLVIPSEVKILERLFSHLKIDTSLALNLANNIASTQEKKIEVLETPDSGEGEAGPQNPSEVKAVQAPVVLTKETSTVQFLRFNGIDDLLFVPGFTPEIVNKLRNFVTVLPARTKINVNTSTAEVLSAVLDKVSLSDAAIMVARRDRAHFLNFVDFKQNFPQLINEDAEKNISFATNFFVINGKVKLNQSLLEVDALIYREARETYILWIKES